MSHHERKSKLYDSASLASPPMSHLGGRVSSAYLGISAGPVVSSTSTVFGHVDVLVVVELGIGRV